MQGVGAVFTSNLGRAVLRTSVPLKAEDNGVAATFTLDEGESVDIQLEWNGEVRPMAEGETDDLFTRTQDFWQNWVSQKIRAGEMLVKVVLISFIRPDGRLSTSSSSPQSPRPASFRPRRVASSGHP